jgi:hypothetical protein
LADELRERATWSKDFRRKYPPPIQPPKETASYRGYIWLQHWEEAIRDHTRQDEQEQKEKQEQLRITIVTARNRIVQMVASVFIRGKSPTKILTTPPIPKWSPASRRTSGISS